MQNWCGTNLTNSIYAQNLFSAFSNLLSSIYFHNLYLQCPPCTLQTQTFIYLYSILINNRKTQNEPICNASHKTFQIEIAFQQIKPALLRIYRSLDRPEQLHTACKEFALVSPEFCWKEFLLTVTHNNRNRKGTFAWQRTIKSA